MSKKISTFCLLTFLTACGPSGGGGSNTGVGLGPVSTSKQILMTRWIGSDGSVLDLSGGSYYYLGRFTQIHGCSPVFYITNTGAYWAPVLSGQISVQFDSTCTTESGFQQFTYTVDGAGLHLLPMDSAGALASQYR